MAGRLQIALLCCYLVEGAVVLTPSGSHGLTQDGVGSLKSFESGKYERMFL